MKTPATRLVLLACAFAAVAGPAQAASYSVSIGQNAAEIQMASSVRISGAVSPRAARQQIFAHVVLPEGHHRDAFAFVYGGDDGEAAMLYPA